MHRFFANIEQLIDNNIEIIGKDVKHIKDVLRLKVKEKIEVVIDGYVYLCEIIRLEKDKVLTQVIEKNKGRNESPIHIVLYQGLAKGNKMDTIIQKCTEIGVKEFYPVALKRSVVKVKDIKKEEAKVERWNTIADEAAKQSKRDILPKVHNIISFDQMANILKNEKNIVVPYEDEKRNSIKGNLKLDGDKIHLIIGPEGGFEQDEIERLKSLGANIFTLGPRILRTETAGAVATTILLYEFGDLGVI
ncbi:MAG: 16S rRNA (uracil(1498)-N(3))-methyltransferase [Tissierellia bacterium]|nr:16S rRNA (uracil(1498)-N(3))-methyltransferase [Tissierellia bacterium]